ncbi:hypothetical protein AB0T83_15325 [Fluviibacterium sp. DFM31]|uniref:Uncharacterized protein n=1 Tax=Meridianimarinicoccus marinus TaxID=3231483 RepID=A0ABV3L987_9RHOB
MKRDLTVPLALAAMLLPTLAHAYIGPGAGVSAIGAALALVAAVFFAIVGFVWYPVKRMMRKRKAAAEQSSDTPPSAE